MDDAPEVDVERPLPVVGGVLPKIARLASRDARVGEHQVRTAQLIESGGSQLVEAVLSGNVTALAAGIDIALDQRRLGCFETRLIHVRDQHPCPFRAQREGQRSANTAGATGDNGQLAVEVLHARASANARRQEMGTYY